MPLKKVRFGAKDNAIYPTHQNMSYVTRYKEDVKIGAIEEYTDLEYRRGMSGLEY